MNGLSDDPCKGGTTAQEMVIVIELSLLFRGGRGECRSCGAQKNVWKQLTQGLRPGLCRSVAPLGLFDAPQSMSVRVLISVSTHT